MHSICLVLTKYSMSFTWKILHFSRKTPIVFSQYTTFHRRPLSVLLFSAPFSPTAGLERESANELSEEYFVAIWVSMLFAYELLLLLLVIVKMRAPFLFVFRSLVHILIARFCKCCFYLLLHLVYDLVKVWWLAKNPLNSRCSPRDSIVKRWILEWLE